MVSNRHGPAPSKKAEKSKHVSAALRSVHSGVVLIYFFSEIDVF